MKCKNHQSVERKDQNVVCKYGRQFNWLKYVCPSSREKKANVKALIDDNGEIFFRAWCEIKTGEELVYSFNEEETLKRKKQRTDYDRNNKKCTEEIYSTADIKLDDDKDLMCTLQNTNEHEKQRNFLKNISIPKQDNLDWIFGRSETGRNTYVQSFPEKWSKIWEYNRDNLHTHYTLPYNSDARTNRTMGVHERTISTNRHVAIKHSIGSTINWSSPFIISRDHQTYNNSSEEYLEVLSTKYTQKNGESIQSNGQEHWIIPTKNEQPQQIFIPSKNVFNGKNGKHVPSEESLCQTNDKDVNTNLLQQFMMKKEVNNSIKKDDQTTVNVKQTL
ncbi:uncharacterized protein LOC124445811 isoform X2 [Xenia sp. Carnegie-2017]|uniref:uncharacterized protein LOC124445811 isoform X2 n=1 Tax=Xenia sp. Carnegie-2017 TaxID=2897299 RepID=UPI001F03B369|nr:uncharacterized protein LOC124445811 isoform X2 [Xenia sp. Carnegie-2017]